METPQSQIKPFELPVYLALSTALCIYTALRAIHVPPIHDEAATFFFYIQRGSFLPFEAHWDAANHILNTGLATLSYNLLGRRCTHKPSPSRLPVFY